MSITRFIFPPGPVFIDKEGRVSLHADKREMQDAYEAMSTIRNLHSRKDRICACATCQWLATHKEFAK